MRRRLLIVVVFLLAGAVVNVAVAWGCALDPMPVAPRHASERRVRSLWHWEVRRYEQHGAVRVVSVLWGGGSLSPDTEVLPESLLLDWSRISLPPHLADAAPGEFDAAAMIRAASEGPNFEQIIDDGRGWPLLSMSGGWSMTGFPRKSEWHVVDCIEIQAPLGKHLSPSSGSHARGLPLGPIWPGFAVNTLLYAGVLWLLFGGPFTVRRLIRVRRGLCPKCGYPMGESAVCTECGKTLPRGLRVVLPVPRDELCDAVLD